VSVAAEPQPPPPAHAPPSGLYMKSLACSATVSAAFTALRAVCASQAPKSPTKLSSNHSPCARVVSAGLAKEQPLTRTSSSAPPGYHFLPQPCMLFSFHWPLKMLGRASEGERMCATALVRASRCSTGTRRARSSGPPRTLPQSCRHESELAARRCSCVAHRSPSAYMKTPLP
jgi:hypothetical protein